MSKKKGCKSLWAASRGPDSIWPCFWSINGGTLTLQLCRCCVVVERHTGYYISLRQTCQHVTYKDCFSYSSISYQHQWLSFLEQQLHKIAKTSCLWCVNQSSLVGKNRQNFVPTPTYSHFRIETKCILSSSWQLVGEIPLNFSFWMVSSDIIAWEKKLGSIVKMP